MPCSSGSTSRGCPTRSRSCSRTRCGSRTGPRSRSDDVEAIADLGREGGPSVEIPFQPARVLMQDFTGVPAVVDLAAMRDAMEELGGDPSAINPQVDVDLIIDHSVQVDAFGNQRAFEMNAERDYERNGERYAFLRWGQTAFEHFRVVPPATGICHQVNLEYLGQCVWTREVDGATQAYPRHPGRHRLPHDDDQRARRPRLGRGRDRGRGRDARPADLDAAPSGDRLQADRRAARGRHRDRPRPDGHGDAPGEGRRLQVRRVLRPGDLGPRPGRPGDDRQHVAGVRLDLRDLPDRRRDPPLPRVHRAADRADRARRRLHPRAGPLPRARLGGATYSDTLELDLGDVEPSIAGPEAPPGPDRARRRQERLPRGDAGMGSGGRKELGNIRDEAIDESFPASDPPAEDHDGDGRQAAHLCRQAAMSPCTSRRATRSRSSSRTARRSSSTTAMS